MMLDDGTLLMRKPEGMTDLRWEVTVRWFEGWLSDENQSMYGDPWTWEICETHRAFIGGCQECEAGNE